MKIPTIIKDYWFYYFPDANERERRAANRWARDYIDRLNKDLADIDENSKVYKAVIRAQLGRLEQEVYDALGRNRYRTTIYNKLVKILNDCL